MDTKQAIKEVLSKAGVSAYRVSLDLGYCANYVQSIYSRKGGVRSDVLQRIVGECGYKLALIKDDDTIIIDE